ALLADPEDLPPEGVHPSAVVDATALLGSGVAVGPHAVVGAGATLGDNVVVCANVYVGADAVIGDGSVLMPGVVVSRRCRIGRRCRLHANAVIGADGFGYYFRDGAYHKIPHIGTVEIGDDVEIGACSCVDRAKFGATRIGDGTKIDNLVQIAHNVQIGKGVILAGLVGVAGSSKLGDYVVLGGHAGIRDNITVGDEVRVAAYSAVLQDVPPGQTIGGIPAFDERQCVRVYHLQQKLPELKKQLEQLQARVNGLENATKDHRP
ncbi:MAG: UDP-3-O-(3-hydroxymyristoyl)glucosamine N-acyltransferase, partial [Planctomycetes bacterium]|nr:UDP-3-O-(3-hydroxymyristoyl)glucosamine N-acyltransferase [Planctomycetota bacterium]